MMLKMTQENFNCENENVAAAKADVDDELYPGELYYPEIDGKIACTCFQCGNEYILENNMKGDEIEKHIFVEDVQGCQNVPNVES